MNESSPKNAFQKTPKFEFYRKTRLKEPVAIAAELDLLLADCAELAAIWFLKGLNRIAMNKPGISAFLL